MPVRVHATGASGRDSCDGDFVAGGSEGSGRDERPGLEDSPQPPVYALSALPFLPERPPEHLLQAQLPEHLLRGRSLALRRLQQVPH